MHKLLKGRLFEDWAQHNKDKYKTHQELHKLTIIIDLKFLQTSKNQTKTETETTVE